MEAIINGLKRFSKGTKFICGTPVFKGTRVPKNQRLAMGIIYTRLSTNHCGSLTHGVLFLKSECEVLGLQCQGDYARFYLDRSAIDNRRIIVWYE